MWSWQLLERKKCIVESVRVGAFKIADMEHDAVEFSYVNKESVSSVKLTGYGSARF